MSDDNKPSKVEIIKEHSRQLRGTITQELAGADDHLSEDNAQLLKHHGSYQQDNRDDRKSKHSGTNPKGKSYIFMVRTRVPGGKLTAEQFLAELDLCEKYGNETLRITSRQGLQLHGILKTDLRSTINAINQSKLTTLAACGDVNRNVMCCPAPYKNSPVRRAMQETALRVADHLKPRTTAYYDIWLKDDDGNEVKLDEFTPVDEPIYGTHYLPRKFKIGFALPDDNCVDVYTQDIGFLAVVENDTIVGYNVLAGGGMGRTPSAEKTFPALGKRMTFIRPEQVLDVAEAIVKVQRDFGNRSDRKVARMKYLIANWGIEKFKSKVEEYYGESLPEPHPADVTDVDDHIGWHAQGDGRWFLGINVENGRIKDEGALRLKTGLRGIVKKFGMPLRLTPLQALILCDVEPAARSEIDRMLVDHGIPQDHELTLVRRYAMACPAIPTCGLAITESERVLPGLIDQLESELARIGLAEERISVHMTGCPNACARPYTPDIGLVGKTLGKYTIFLGGNVQGTRLAFIYKDLITLEGIIPALVPVLEYYKSERNVGETFGDFCFRKGVEELNAVADRQPA